MEQGFSGQPPTHYGGQEILAPTSQQVVQEILDKVPGIDKIPRDEFWCECGVKLKLLKIPSQLILNVLNQLKEPEPPMFFDQEAGRERPNLDDPAYKAAINENNITRSVMTVDIYYALGTRLKERPTEIPGPDDAEWADAIQEVTNNLVTIKDSGRSRYVSWLKYYPIVTDDELGPLIEKIQRFSGLVPETDAREAEDSFPGSDGTQRNPVIRIHANAESESGPSV